MYKIDKAVMLTEQEYGSMVRATCRDLGAELNKEEKETIVLALRLMDTRESIRIMRAIGGTVNGRSLGEHRRTATRLIAKLEGRMTWKSYDARDVEESPFI